jgi:hypothetical protein
MKLSKRFATGLSFLVSYGIGKTLEQVSVLNAQDFVRSNFEATPAQERFTLRTFPLRFGDVRRPDYQNWDTSLSKTFPIHEEIRLQFRFEMVNMMNHLWFAGHCLGRRHETPVRTVESDPRNLPRFIKLATHLHW